MPGESDAAVEVLKPEDFAIFGGFAMKDGRQVEIWIPGSQVVLNFRMALDNVRVTVDKHGTLSIEPIKKVSSIGGFYCQGKFWKRRSELEPLTVITANELDKPS